MRFMAVLRPSPRLPPVMIAVLLVMDSPFICLRLASWDGSCPAASDQHATGTKLIKQISYSPGLPAESDHLDSNPDLCASCRWMQSGPFRPGGPGTRSGPLLLLARWTLPES